MVCSNGLKTKMSTPLKTETTRLRLGCSGYDAAFHHLNTTEIEFAKQTHRENAQITVAK